MLSRSRTKQSVVTKSIRLAALALPALLVAGCAQTAALTGGSDAAAPTPTQTVAPVVAPLTGVQYAADANPFLAGPVVMGKIDNSPEARPQLGLSKTDVVIDEMVEGGLTRFLAIWHSQMPASFGPIRSVRPMDPDLATAYGGIIAYSGGQRPFVAAMKATGLYNADETSEQGKGTMERVTNRVAPHNLFVKAQNLQAAHPDLAAPKQLFTFNTDAADASGTTAAISGKVVLDVKAQFPAATALWTWNGKAWARTQDGKILTDALDGKQLTAANVVVLRVAVDRSFRDPRYGFVPKTLLEGTGKGQVFSDGKVLDVTWTKAKATDYPALTTASGEVVKLAPGNTWFELVPSDVGKVTVTYPKAATPATSATPKK
ncbi:MAG: hypothetical protein RIR34_1374 [Actinomycetota bacterium]|jgi:hypothetical protein